LVIEDDKISLDALQQQIEEDEDHVQSTDIVRLSWRFYIAYTSLTQLSGCHAEAVDIVFLDPSSHVHDSPPPSDFPLDFVLLQKERKALSRMICPL